MSWMQNELARTGLNSGRTARADPVGDYECKGLRSWSKGAVGIQSSNRGELHHTNGWTEPVRGYR